MRCDLCDIVGFLSVIASVTIAGFEMTPWQPDINWVWSDMSDMSRHGVTFPGKHNFVAEMRIHNFVNL